MNHTLARVLPFSIYMSFIAILEMLKLSGIHISSQELCLIYPVKIVLVVISLVVFRKFYTEIVWSQLLYLRHTLLSIIVGTVVIILWINLAVPPFISGKLSPYAHNVFLDERINILLLLIRASGAVLVVPVMEELFWRSFLCRYLVNSDFMSVRQGKFTPFTFISTVILFGLEHQLWLAGMIAGIAYNYIYYKTSSLAQCILSHALSNMLLALFVVYGDNWKFW